MEGVALVGLCVCLLLHCWHVLHAQDTKVGDLTVFNTEPSFTHYTDG